MGMIVAPHRFGTPVTPFGALVYQASAGQSIVSSTALTWDSEVYDVGGWHDTASNTSRLTVPPGVTLVRLTTNLRSTSTGNPKIDHRLNGSAFQGQGKGDSESNSGDDCTNIASAIMATSTFDYYETFAVAGGSGGTVVANTWASIEAISTSLKRVLVKKTGNQAISAGATTTVTWETEDYDTDAFHDNVTNTSRLTAPATGRYRVTANLVSGSVTGQFVISFLKNGASARGLPARDCDTGSEENLNAVSAVLDLTSGDYIECQAFHTSATNVVSDLGTWMMMEEVPATYKCCTAYKSGTQSISNNTTTAVAFGAELYDDDAMHDNSTNNTRVAVPSGCTRARASFCLKTPSATGQAVAEVYKNGATYTGAPRFETDTAGTDNVSGFGAWVDVTPGDYFELMFFQDSGSSMTLGTDNETWLCLECQ